MDGDNAATMRYTEVPSLKITARNARGPGKETVDFQPNYDGKGRSRPSSPPTKFRIFW